MSATLNLARRTALICAALASIAIVTSAVSRAAGDTIVVNGTHLAPDAVAQVDQRTYVALRPVGEALGAEIHYDAKSKQVTVTTVLLQMVFHIDDPTVTVNGEPKKLEAPARQVGSRVMLPLRGLADALGADLKVDAAKHEIVMVLAGSSAPRGAPTAPPIQSSNTLEGTVITVTSNAEVPSVDIDVKGMTYTITVPPNTKVQFRDTHGTVAGDGTLAQVKPGDTLLATLDSQGRVLSMSDVFSGVSGTIASVAGQNMVLASGRVIATDEHATSVTLDGKTATMADLHTGDIVTVRSDPRTGKVREVVAFTPGHQATTTATAPPDAANPQSLQISGVFARTDHPFRVGQAVDVAFEGTPGGTASFDLSNVILATPMREVRPGRYEGTYTVQVGTNLVDAPILVTLSKGGQTAHAVGPQPLNIITEPPQVKETAPSTGAKVNSLRPSIYVTFETLGGKGMDAGSLQLLVDGKDVTSQSTRTGAFISYFPTADLHEGTIAVRVRGADVAGNTLDYSWSFVISSR
jgi:hypothetical protein